MTSLSPACSGKDDVDKGRFVRFNGVMGEAPAFIAKLQVVMGEFVGEIVSQSIIRGELAKLNRDETALTAEDCKTLNLNILTAVSLFVTKEEAGKLQDEMDKLFASYFS
jgi:hypothetical protein